MIILSRNIRKKDGYDQCMLAKCPATLFPAEKNRENVKNSDNFNKR